MVSVILGICDSALGIFVPNEYFYLQQSHFGLLCPSHSTLSNQIWDVGGWGWEVIYIQVFQFVKIDGFAQPSSPCEYVLPRRSLLEWRTTRFPGYISFVGEIPFV